MPKKRVIIAKTIGRKWFLFIVAIIIIVAFYFPIIAIWMISITLGLFLLSFIPGYLFKNKFYKFLLNHNKIEDELIARRFEKPIKKVREELFDLSQKQIKKRWLIIFLDKHYIFYNQETIDKFTELYNKGFNEKEILNNLTDFKLATRNEIKAIKEGLLKLGRLSEREVTVKEYSEKQRFED